MVYWLWAETEARRVVAMEIRVKVFMVDVLVEVVLS